MNGFPQFFFGWISEGRWLIFSWGIVGIFISTTNTQSLINVSSGGEKVQCSIIPGQLSFLLYGRQISSSKVSKHQQLPLKRADDAKSVTMHPNSDMSHNMTGRRYKWEQTFHVWSKFELCTGVYNCTSLMCWCQILCGGHGYSQFIDVWTNVWNTSLMCFSLTYKDWGVFPNM